MLEVVFFRNSNGREPVRDWLLTDITKDERRIIGEDLKTVQGRWPLGMPLVRFLGEGLWEVRSNLGERIARIMFFMADNKLILVHGFIKKSQKTPKEDLEIAKQRMRLFSS